MMLRRLTQGNGPWCEDGDCPNIYETESGSFVVQGDNAEHHFADAGASLPAHERAVEIPRDVMTEFIRRFTN